MLRLTYIQITVQKLQNSWNPKKTTKSTVAKKNHFDEAAVDPKDKKGPHERREKGNKLH